MNKRRIVTLFVAVCLVLAALYARDFYKHFYQLTIAGQTMHAPKGWRVASKTAFARTPTVNSFPGVLEIVDRRDHPDRPATFVAEWKARTGRNGFRAFRIDEYRDQTLDQTNMHCVALRSKEPYPLLMYCTSAAGHWRLTLDGHDSDIGGLDDLAKQLASLGDR